MIEFTDVPSIKIQTGATPSIAERYKQRYQALQAQLNPEGIRDGQSGLLLFPESGIGSPSLAAANEKAITIPIIPNTPYLLTVDGHMYVVKPTTDGTRADIVSLEPVLSLQEKVDRLAYSASDYSKVAPADVPVVGVHFGEVTQPQRGPAVGPIVGLSFKTVTLPGLNQTPAITIGKIDYDEEGLSHELPTLGKVIGVATINPPERTDENQLQIGSGDNMRRAAIDQAALNAAKLDIPKIAGNTHLTNVLQISCYPKTMTPTPSIRLPIMPNPHA